MNRGVTLKYTFLFGVFLSLQGCQQFSFSTGGSEAQVAQDVNGEILEIPQETLPIQSSSDVVVGAMERLNESPVVQSLQSLWASASEAEREFFAQWLQEQASR